jgi:phenylpropionate dioxygenase-like ring-hydroxylating dioxygenase large terminal subunit
MRTTFLPAALYNAPAIAQRERECYAKRLWHPLTAVAALPDSHVQAFALLGIPLLLTRSQGVVRCFFNRCPHRGVALQTPADQPHRCRRLVCPYHGWCYDLQGQLQAAAREGDFIEPFARDAWPLQALQCREFGGLIWAALGPDPLPLEVQLDLVLQEARELFERPRDLLLRQSQTLECNWKIAHDNTLDDYHVAIAHPTTLHREQGPVRLYRHTLSEHGSLLATPYGQEGEFLTFGLAPWTHLLFWPDGRLALIQFPPIDVSCCQMEVWLMGSPSQKPLAMEWMDEIQTFLAEDRRLVEAAQLGYSSGLVPGPPHRLEQRILQQQSLYARLMDVDHLTVPDDNL